MTTTYITLPEKDFEEIRKKIDLLLEYVLGNSSNPITQTMGDWLTEAETIKLLGKKKTSLYNLRLAKKLEFTNVGKTIFYSKSSIIHLLDNSKHK